MLTPINQFISVALLLILPVLTRAESGRDATKLVMLRRQALANGTATTIGGSSSSTALPPSATTNPGSSSSDGSSGSAARVPPVTGAPSLPDISNFDPSKYPPLDRVPPIDSPQMKQWISQVDLANAPKWSPTGIDGCSNTTFNAQAIAEAGPEGRCWWTCERPGQLKCTRPTDVSFCPTKNTWGASFDDGPSDSTPKLLNYLSIEDIKATFFVVGSRVISRPEILQREYMAGHQISVHTWSHRLLTTLTNEEIIGELMWTREAIKAVTGVTPTTMRPPFGDIDDRVRYISMQLNMTPILWTQANGETFDTQDWRLGDPSLGTTMSDVLGNFNEFLNASRSLSTGFIILAHDLHETSVDLAIQHILPAGKAFSPSLTLEPIITCLNQPNSQAYLETMNVATAVNTTTTSSSSTPSSSSTTSTRSTASGTAQSASASPSSIARTSAANHINFDHSASLITISLMLGSGLFAIVY